MHSLAKRLVPLISGVRKFSDSSRNLTNLLEKLKHLENNQKKSNKEENINDTITEKVKIGKTTLTEENDDNSRLSSLLTALKKHTESDETGKTSLSISEIFAGIKVNKDRQQFRPQFRPHLKSEQATTSFTFERTFFGGPGLDIFTEDTIANAKTQKPEGDSLFDQMDKESVEASIRMLPRNFFEEAAMLTKEGKLWNFPIDNEQGMEEEAKSAFYDHIFLERFLPMFPKTGPVRHFIELAIVGLSKNPYLTVQEKEEHLKWFADYFKGNRVSV